jgi:anti-anti-sigma regulatory factor
MEISVQQVPGGVPVSILKLSGELDAANYLAVIDRVRQVHESGIPGLVIDLSDVTFLSSSGLVALHSAALLMRGDQPPSPEAGWAAYHAIASDVEGGFEKCCVLYNPQGRARKTLQMTGFDGFLHIHDDLDEAVASLTGG